MKLLLMLLSISTFSSCDKSKQSENQEIMTKQSQKNVLELVKKNDISGLEAVLKAGANVNTTDNNGRSILLLATINKQTDMAKMLVGNGADVNKQAQNLDSPFLYAGASGQTQLVKLFLENGARFDVFNRYNGSALIPACERGHVETVRVLVNTKNYPIDHVNRLGWTALMEAVILGDGSSKYQEIVQILKDGGANLSIPDKEGISPLQHAKNRRYNEIVRILSK